MSKFCTLTPSAGHDYSELWSAVEDLSQHIDFILNDMSSRWDSKPADAQSLIDAGYTSFRIRNNAKQLLGVVSTNELQTLLDTDREVAAGTMTHKEQRERLGFTTTIGHITRHREKLAQSDNRS